MQSFIVIFQKPFCSGNMKYLQVSKQVQSKDSWPKFNIIVELWCKMSSSEIDWAIVTLKFIVGYFLVYFATITIFIIIPATLNISLNAKERYVAALLKIFEVGISSIFVLVGLNQYPMELAGVYRVPKVRDVIERDGG